MVPVRESLRPGPELGNADVYGVKVNIPPRRQGDLAPLRECAAAVRPVQGPLGDPQFVSSYLD